MTRVEDNRLREDALRSRRSFERSDTNFHRDRYLRGYYGDREDDRSSRRSRTRSRSPSRLSQSNRRYSRSPSCHSRSSRSNRRTRSRTPRRSRYSRSPRRTLRFKSRSQSPWITRQQRNIGSDPRGSPSRSSKGGRRDSPSPVSKPLVFNFVTDKLAKCMVDGIPTKESKAIQGKYDVEFEDQLFSLTPPATDDCFVDRVKKSKNRKVTEASEKQWLAMPFKVMDIAIPLFYALLLS